MSKAVNQADLEQSENYNHANRQQDNQTVSVKSFISERKAHQCRARIFRTKSEKESSQEYLSDISETLSFARERVISAQDQYILILEDHSKWVRLYSFCILNNSDQRDFAFENLQKTQRQCQEAKQKIKKAEIQLKNLQEKQAQIPKKMIMKNYMI